MAEDYDPDNLLDRLSDPETLAVNYFQVERRERSILDRRLPQRGGEVLSVGCGWRPGRHLFPAPQWRMVGVDMDEAKAGTAKARGLVDDAVVARAGELPFEDASFDVVLYRLVLHHVAYTQPLGPVVEEAARIVRPGGALVVIEPNVYHPVGAALTLANRAGLGTLVHGTPDDIPLSPRALSDDARGAGLAPEVHAVTFMWRRMPAAVQRALAGADELGSRPRLRLGGHTFMLIARRAGGPDVGSRP
jgi:SAM-dependent methyltransferase